jgi:hypothetical protein
MKRTDNAFSPDMARATIGEALAVLNAIDDRGDHEGMLIAAACHLLNDAMDELDAPSAKLVERERRALLKAAVTTSDAEAE